MTETNNIQKFLLGKFTEKWLKDNKAFFEDVENLAHAVTMFEIMWGIPLKLSVDEPEEPKGRWTGESIVNLINEAADEYDRNQ